MELWSCGWKDCCRLSCAGSITQVITVHGFLLFFMSLFVNSCVWEENHQGEPNDLSEGQSIGVVNVACGSCVCVCVCDYSSAKHTE